MSERGLKRSEYAAAGAMTVWAVFLHIRFLIHAGPLWRDEINGLNVAAMPTVTDIWGSIVYYPFPILHDLVLRAWIAAGLGSNDFQLRLLALFLGIFLIGAIWMSCRSIDRRMAPVIPLAALALNPVILQSGDWVRPYGLAMIFILLCFATVWRLTFFDSNVRTVVIAAVAAILSVQTLFMNAAVLGAICAAGILVSMCGKRFDRAGKIGVVGVFAALSLIPYVSALGKAGEWAGFFMVHYSWAELALVALSVLTSRSAIVGVLWAAVVALAIVGSLQQSRAVEGRESEPVTTERVIFAVIALLFGFGGTLSYLWISGGAMERYFAPLAAVASVALFAMATNARAMVFVRAGILLFAVAVAAVMIPFGLALTGERATNADLVAQKLANDANSDDLIVLTTYTYGIAFDRYYRGPAKWMTIPEVADRSQHRWDLVLQVLKQAQPIENILAQIRRTLQTGHTVFVVGALPAGGFSGPAQPDERRDEESLRAQIAAFLRQHVQITARIPVGDERTPINSYENLPLFSGSGWRD